MALEGPGAVPVKEALMSPAGVKTKEIQTRGYRAFQEEKKLEAKAAGDDAQALFCHGDREEASEECVVIPNRSRGGSATV